MSMTRNLSVSSGSPPVLYHGTTRARAHSILAHGFRRSPKPSYTGTAVNLSENVGTAYEYGTYESNGVVLEVRLKSDVRWSEPEGLSAGKGFDEVFRRTGLDALRAYSGNVWLLWNVDAVESVRLLAKREAVRLLADYIRSEGPEVGYNGIVDTYAAVLWNDDQWLRRHDADEVAAVRKTLTWAGVEMGLGEGDSVKPDTYSIDMSMGR